MALSSQISTLFEPDVPRNLNANYRIMDRADRTFVDQQVLGVQKHLASSLIRGQIGTNFQLAESSAALVAGDLVCAAPEAAQENPATSAVRKVTKAVAVALSAAGVILGIALTSAVPGGWVRVATDGIVGSDLTGLAAGSPGYVRASPFARPEMVASLSTGDTPLGYVDGYGNLSLRRERIVAVGGGGSGGYTTVRDETSVLTQRTTLRFAGNDVVASDSAGETLVTIDGGLRVDGSRTLSADWNAGAFKISSSVAPTTGNHLTNKTYVDGQDALALLKDGSRGLTADWNAGGFNISVSLAPTSANHLTNKAYVDGLVSGLVIRSSVAALSVSNIASLSGLATTVDGVALNTDGMRVLLTAQSTGSQNGPWAVHSGAWTRPSDFLAGSDGASAYFFVQQGTLYADTGWVCTSNSGSAVVGTNSLAFSQFSAAGVVVADEITLTKVGNTIALKSGGITDTYVSAAAAIAGTKIAPDFGSQNILTSGFLRLGLAPGSGSGVASAANTGSIRGSRGSPGFSIYARNNADTGDVPLLVWDSTSGTYQLGKSSASNQPTDILLDASSTVRLRAGTATWGVSVASSGSFNVQANTLAFADTILAPSIAQGDNVTNLATAATLTIIAQKATGTSSTGGSLVLGSNTGTLAHGNVTVQRGGTTVAQWTSSSSDYIALGGSVPVTGALRLAHGSLVTGRNNANSATKTILDWGVTANDNLHVGDPSTIMVLDASATGIGWIVRLNGNDRFTVSNIQQTWYVSNALFTTGQASPTLGQESSSTASGQTLTLTAQNTTFAGGTGGALALTAGSSSGASGTRTGGLASLASGVGTSADGDLRLLRGAAIGLQLVKPSSGLVVGLVRTSAVTATEIPVNTGDGVVYVGNVTTAPTTGSPVSGSLLWSQNTTDGDGWLTKNPSGGFWSQAPQKNWHRYYKSGRCSTSGSAGSVTINLGALGDGGGSVRMFVTSRDATNSSQQAVYGFSFNSLGGSLQSGSTTPTSLYGSDGAVSSVALAYPGSPNIRVDITPVDAVAYTHEVLMEITFHPNAA